LIQPGFASGVAALCRDKALRRGERGILPLVAAAGILLVLSPSLWAATGNSSTGTGALAHDTTGADNTADGFDTLNLTTSGTSNTATGDNALYGNTTGSYNTSDGQGALYTNTAGDNNVAVGFWALHLSTTGTDNTAIGDEALYNCVTDSEETALGYQALFSDTVGSGGLANQNVALGYQALYSSTDGFENLASGYRALFHSIEGDANTALGYEALFGITTGEGNIGIGHNAGSLLTTGSSNIDIGHPGVAGDNKIIRIGDGVTQTATYLTGVIHGNGAGLTGVTVAASAVTGAITGSQLAAGSVTGKQLAAGAVGSAQLAPGVTLGGNTTIGNEISLPATDSSGTNGVLNIGGLPFLGGYGGNVFVGGAGNFTMTGGNNTAIGPGALGANLGGDYNTASGGDALGANVAGIGNVADGYDALKNNDSDGSGNGADNTAVGTGALLFNVDGADNTAIGWSALEQNNGSANIAVGEKAGLNLTTGANNIDIGSPGVAGESDIIRIGDGSTQTDTYLTGVIHGDGSGLSNIPVTSLATPIPATAIAAAPAGMVLIPAGSFTMGNVVGSGSDTDITDAAPITVTVSAFYMDANLVSLGQWHSVYYWAKGNGYTDLDVGGGDGARNPVYDVNWWDCVKWCNARSQQAGLTPVYYTDAGFTTVYQTGDSGTVYMNMAAGGYRLPTEAEWEKAARGGLSRQRFPWGDTIDETLANYYGDTGGYNYDLGPYGYNALDTLGTTSGSTTPIGTFPANGYGLYDMAGNVEEWCWDWYGTPYGQPTTTNPTGPTSGSSRALRGGFWSYYASTVRCAFRNYNSPDGNGPAIGFRSVLSPGQP